MALSELSNLTLGGLAITRAAAHTCLFESGGGGPGHQCPVSEVSSQTRCAHELPVHHATGRGKNRHLGRAGSPHAGSDLALASCSIWSQGPLLGGVPDQPVNQVDFLMPAALSAPLRPQCKHSPIPSNYSNNL